MIEPGSAQPVVKIIPSTSVRESELPVNPTPTASTRPPIHMVYLQEPKEADDPLDRDDIHISSDTELDEALNSINQATLSQCADWIDDILATSNNTPPQTQSTPELVSPDLMIDTPKPEKMCESIIDIMVPHTTLSTPTLQMNTIPLDNSPFIMDFDLDIIVPKSTNEVSTQTEPVFMFTLAEYLEMKGQSEQETQTTSLDIARKPTCLVKRYKFERASNSTPTRDELPLEDYDIVFNESSPE